jgi:hypothetical protein
MYQLDSELIPVPPMERVRNCQPKYPYEQMQVGQSFFVAYSSETHKSIRTMSTTIKSSICNYRKKNASKAFTSRTVDGGVRVWRVK